MDDNFQSLMHKLASSAPLQHNDEVKIQEIAGERLEQRHLRKAILVPEEDKYPYTKLLQGPVYLDGRTGLQAKGWMEFPSKHQGDGQYGSVTLGMKICDHHKKPEFRQLCAIKVKEMVMRVDSLKEVVAIKCLVHQNIIDYYDHFLVEESGQNAPVSTSPEQEATSGPNPAARTSPKSRQRTVADPIDIPGRRRDYATSVPALPVLWIMMEFADAGNLLTEMSRYPDNCIPESGVLYYSKQVLDGLKYMHGREIAHRDLPFE